MRWCLGLLIFWASLQVAWSQSFEGAYFLSMEQVVQVKDPERWVSRHFILRQSSEGRMNYFRVPMSELLFKSKKKFILPQIETPSRIALSFFNSRNAVFDNQPLPEVLLNERLVLADSDSLLALLPDGTVQELAPAPSLGVALVVAPEGSVCTRMQATVAGTDCSLPAFFYTYKGSVPLLVVEKEGYWPQEVEPLVSDNGFKEWRLDLVPVPKYDPKYQLPTLDLSRDSAILNLPYLDLLLEETRHARDEVEHEFETYLYAMETALYQPMERRSKESEVDYALRLGYRDSLLSSVGRAERKSAAYQTLVRELENRRLLLTSYREQLINQKKWNQGIQRQLLKERVWHRFYGRIHGALGRHMPSWSSSPGPDQLWAAGAGAAYLFPIYQDWSGEFRFTGQYSRWLYHEGVSTHSSQSRVGVDMLLGWPLAVAAKSPDIGEVKGVAVLLQGGVGVHWSNTQVRTSYYDHRKEVVPQMITGLQVHWTDLPLMVELHYSYGWDEFGDLGLAVGIPLPWVF